MIGDATTYDGIKHVSATRVGGTICIALVSIVLATIVLVTIDNRTNPKPCSTIREDHHP
jgi:hypothetical protein